MSEDADPVTLILQSLPAIYDVYASQRLDQAPEVALDATLRIVFSPNDFLLVSGFHAGMHDDEYGLSKAEGGRYLYARLVQTVETSTKARSAR